MRLRLFGVGLLFVTAACSAGSDDAASVTTAAPDSTPSTATVGADPSDDLSPPVTDSPTDSEPGTSEPASTDPAEVESEPVSTDEPEVEASPWKQIVADATDCACSDGSEFSFFERPGDPTKVMLFFEGGGACFNLETCDPNGDPTYTTEITQTTDSMAKQGGVFDAANPENPVADHSIVYVPYCTGDVHLGNSRTEYSDDVVIEHRGAVNANAALEYLIATYPDAEQVLVAGESAGSVPTPLVAGLVADELPDAEIITLGDSSGAYPDVSAVNELVGNLWGTTNAIPDWPENEGLEAADWSFPGLYIQAGHHAPDITFARIDFAFDEVQALFAALAGIGADAVVEQIDATEAQIEAAGTPLAVFVAPGTEHTIIGDDEVYEMEVEGVRLIDWITELIAGRVPADVRCVDCAG